MALLAKQVSRTQLAVLAMLLATLFEIKANGLEPLLAPFREKTDPRYRDKDPRQYREGDRSLDTDSRKPGT